MKITSTDYIGSYVRNADCPEPQKPEYAFIGRSNVGKSSLINMLTGKKKLAHVSGSPGKTQTLNYFLINESWYLVDLPGYGFAKVSQNLRKQWKKMIEQYIRERQNLICLFVLIDSRLSPQKSDLEFIAKLGEWQVPFAIVFTKSDKTKQRERQQNINAFFEEMKKDWEFLPIYFVTSAEKRNGREELLEYIEEYNIRFGAIA